MFGQKYLYNTEMTKVATAQYDEDVVQAILNKPIKINYSDLDMYVVGIETPPQAYNYYITKYNRGVPLEENCARIVSLATITDIAEYCALVGVPFSKDDYCLFKAEVDKRNAMIGATSW